MKRLYLAFAVIGTIVPYAAFVPWLVRNGLDLGLLWSQMFDTGISTFFVLDVLVAAVLVLVLVARAAGRGVPLVWLAALGTLCVGVSLGLPLYLYFVARHEEETRGETIGEGGRAGLVGA